MTAATSLRDVLGPATPSEQFLHDLVGEILAPATPAPLDVTVTRAEPVPYDFGSPATGAVVRLGGTADGIDWSVFVKVLQSPRHWRFIDRMPSPARAEFIAEFPWRAELVAWDPALTERLPDGLRVPTLYRLVDLGADRLAVWMEDIDADPDPWSPSRFARAAELLGELAGNRSDPSLWAGTGRPPCYGLQRYVDGPARNAIRIVADDATWHHPALVAHADLQGDLLDLADRIPALLDLACSAPQALPHGDASPQNLLVPRGEPDTLVVIDLAFQTQHAIGFDLAQLLVGLAHAGQLPHTALPAIDAGLVPSFEAGCHKSLRPASPHDIETGYLTALALRSGFTTLPLHELDTAEPALIAERCSLTRFILDRTRHLGQ
jgi:Phosphotransferase enzyme family